MKSKDRGKSNIRFGIFVIQYFFFFDDYYDFEYFEVSYGNNLSVVGTYRKVKKKVSPIKLSPQFSNDEKELRFENDRQRKPLLLEKSWS